MTSQDAVPFSRPSTPDATEKVRVGFIGLGNMGYPMARNLAARGFSDGYSAPPLIVWNRSQNKADVVRFVAGADKVRIAQSPEEVALESDIILVNLANDTVVTEIYNRVLGALEVRSINRSLLQQRTLIVSSRSHHQRKPRYLSRPAPSVMTHFMTADTYITSDSPVSLCATPCLGYQNPKCSLRQLSCARCTTCCRQSDPHSTHEWRATL